LDCHSFCNLKNTTSFIGQYLGNQVFIDYTCSDQKDREDIDMSNSLFERLGGEEGIRKISSDVVDLHRKNPTISARFSKSDLPTLKNTVSEFFITGSGGPEVYKGKDMLSAHKHMNISDNEYMAAVDDVMTALTNNGIGDREKGEVLHIFYTLRPDIVGV